MIICIAEKPSVAREIANILGAKTAKQGFYEGNGYQVTWTFGHFCSLKEPHEYADEWKRWSLEYLPMLPKPFGIKIIENEGVKRQFSVIEKLIENGDEVINCGDAGQEGELIQRWVLQKAKCKIPVKRLWISSLTEEAIREGFNNLVEESKFDKLFEAGLSRAIGDWLLGINATRLYSVKYGRGRTVLSIGRVQTPTLALIVNRYLEIANFIPTPYWEIKTLYRTVIFNITKGRFLKKEDAESALANISDHPFVIKDIEKKDGLEYAPRLFDLTSLQVECNKKFAMSADETLKTVQTLYEKKVTTYPRVDTQYLSEDLHPKIPGILRGLTNYQNLTSSILAGKIKKDKRVFDDKKITDHHAIIPTGVPANNLNTDENKVYDLIVKRFIAAFYPVCKIATTTVLGDVNATEFKTTGKQILSPGWRVVFDKESDNEEDELEKESDAVLPDFVIGESGSHEPSLLEKQTTPPKYYTEATLLRAMETAGKLIEDGELRDALKENGIGRPSTRAAIIETLFKRNYIKKEKKNLLPTQTGVELIETIKEDLLKSAELTGIWENKLRKIEKGEYTPVDFINEMKDMISQIVTNVKIDRTSSITIEEKIEEQSNNKKTKSINKEKSSTPKKKKSKTLVCPICKKGKILKGKTGYGCSEYKKTCDFLITFDKIGDNSIDDMITNYQK